MKKTITILLLLVSTSVFSKESLYGLKIESSEDILNLVAQDSLGPVSFTDIDNGIKNKEEYRQSVPYNLKHTEKISTIGLEVDGSIGFGLLEFTVRDSSDLDKKTIEKHMASIGIGPTSSSMHDLLYRWKKSDFSCELSYIYNDHTKELNYYCQKI